MNRRRPIARSAVVAFVWVVLTTPASILPLLGLIERLGGPVSAWMNGLPFTARAAVLGGLLIGLPLLGTLLAMFALGRIKASWSPMRGGAYARMAITIGVLSMLAGAGLFIAGLL